MKQTAKEQFHPSQLQKEDEEQDSFLTPGVVKPFMLELYHETAADAHAVSSTTTTKYLNAYKLKCFFFCVTHKK